MIELQDFPPVSSLLSFSSLWSSYVVRRPVYRISTIRTVEKLENNDWERGKKKKHRTDFTTHALALSVYNSMSSVIRRDLWPLYCLSGWAWFGNRELSFIKYSLLRWNHGCGRNLYSTIKLRGCAWEFVCNCLVCRTSCCVRMCVYKSFSLSGLLKRAWD